MDSLLNDVEYQEIYETLAGTERGQAFLNTFAAKHKSDDAEILPASDNSLADIDQSVAQDDDTENADVADLNVDASIDADLEITPEVPEADNDIEAAALDTVELETDEPTEPEQEPEVDLNDDLPDSDSAQETDLEFDSDAPSEATSEEEVDIDDTNVDDIQNADTQNTDNDDTDTDDSEEDATPIDLDLLQVEAPLEAGEVVVEGDQDDGVPEDMSQNAPEPDHQPDADAAPLIDDINISAEAEEADDSEETVDEAEPEVSEIDALADEVDDISDLSQEVSDDMPDDLAQEETAEIDLDQDDLALEEVAVESEPEIALAKDDEAEMNEDLSQELTSLKTRLADLEEKIAAL